MVAVDNDVEPVLFILFLVLFITGVAIYHIYA